MMQIDCLFNYVKNVSHSHTYISHVFVMLQVGDRILAVDGNDIRHSSHELAVKTIKNASGKMRLLLQSLNTGVIILHSKNKTLGLGKGKHNDCHYIIMITEYSSIYC